MSKAATVYVLDVSADMEITSLNHGRQVLLEIIKQKCRTGKAQDQVALYLVGSKIRNFFSMDEVDEYNGVNQVWPLNYTMENPTVDLLNIIEYNINDEAQTCYDVLEGIIWAIDQISRHCKHYKYTKKIIVLTSILKSQSVEYDDQLWDQVTLKAQSDEISVNVIFCSTLKSNNNNVDLSSIAVTAEEFKNLIHYNDQNLLVNEKRKLLEWIVQRTGGKIYTNYEAILASSDLMSFHKQASRVYLRTILSLGDPLNPKSYIEFPVGIQIKTLSSKIPHMHVHSTEALKQGLEITAVANNPYYVYAPPPDDNENEGEFNVKLENEEEHVPENYVIKAYRYGTSVIPVSQWEKDIEVGMVQETRCFNIIAFVPISSIKREYLISTTYLVLPDDKFEEANVRFGCLVHSLMKHKLAILAKFCSRDRVAPRLVVLTTDENEFEFNNFLLILNDLPFAEDVRTLCLPSLDFRPESERNIPKSCSRFTKVQKIHCPNDQQKEAMRSFVSELSLKSLCSLSPEENKNRSTEDFVNNFLIFQNPKIRRYNNLVEHRAQCGNMVSFPPRSAWCASISSFGESQKQMQVEQLIQKLLIKRFYGNLNNQEDDFEYDFDELVESATGFSILPWNQDKVNHPSLIEAINNLENVFNETSTEVNEEGHKRKQNFSSIKRARDDSIDLSSLGIPKRTLH